MKTERCEIRIEPNLLKYVKAAAAFDRRSLSSLLVHAAIEYGETLKARGWNAKNAPAPRDARRKANTETQRTQKEVAA